MEIFRAVCWNELPNCQKSLIQSKISVLNPAKAHILCSHDPFEDVASNWSYQSFVFLQISISGILWMNSYFTVPFYIVLTSTLERNIVLSSTLDNSSLVWFDYLLWTKYWFQYHWCSVYNYIYSGPNRSLFNTAPLVNDCIINQSLFCDKCRAVGSGLWVRRRSLIKSITWVLLVTHSLWAGCTSLCRLIRLFVLVACGLRACGLFSE